MPPRASMYSSVTMRFIELDAACRPSRSEFVADILTLCFILRSIWEPAVYNLSPSR